MISRLRGILIAKQAPAIFVEVHGITYEVLIPLNNFYNLPTIGEEIILHTHFIVKENEQSLYGFFDDKQKHLFRTLIKVNGVGPKTALMILSGIDTDILINNIANNDVSNLVRVPGIGTKTAQRLVIELKDKIANIHTTSSLNTEENTNSTIANDAIDALVALGYKVNDAQRVINKHRDKSLSSEDLIRLALREI